MNSVDTSSSCFSVDEFEPKRLEYPVFSRRVCFTINEDKKLCLFVQRFGTENWELVSKLMRVRTEEQCKERYSNYISKKSELIDKLNKNQDRNTKFSEEHNVYQDMDVYFTKNYISL